MRMYAMHRVPSGEQLGLRHTRAVRRGAGTPEVLRYLTLLNCLSVASICGMWWTQNMFNNVEGTHISSNLHSQIHGTKLGSQSRVNFVQPQMGVRERSWGSGNLWHSLRKDIKGKSRNGGGEEKIWNLAWKVYSMKKRWCLFPSPHARLSPPL